MALLCQTILRVSFYPQFKDSILSSKILAWYTICAMLYLLTEIEVSPEDMRI
jgi:hypothetical protein